jgi:hypothetical protein
LCVSAALAASAGIASADTLYLGSFGSTNTNPGFNNAAASFNVGASTASSPVDSSSATYNVGDGGIWTAAGSINALQSSWVSQNANNGPGGSNANSTNFEPNGIYVYTSTFTLSNADYAGGIDVMADDTVAVFLNGTEVQLPDTGPNDMCQVGQPNCTTPLFVSLPLGDFISGTNTLTFDVYQTNKEAEGLDFYGSISSTPEPNSLLLLGTGLLALGAFVYRRRVQI